MPIIEIGVFIQVGDLLGLMPTILIVFITAIVGVNLLKKQGLKAWTDIQLSLAQGKIPAVEMASAAQLLFAGALLLTPGFVTDAVGFSLMIPSVREHVAKLLIKRWQVNPSYKHYHASYSTQQTFHTHESSSDVFNDPRTSKGTDNGRIIEGEYEDQSKKH